MTNKAEATNVQGQAQSNEKNVGLTEPINSGKKAFVEPELTVSVDILEATTFFSGTKQRRVELTVQNNQAK